MVLSASPVPTASFLLPAKLANCALGESQERVENRKKWVEGEDYSVKDSQYCFDTWI